jgi:hypothetical protein
VGYLAVDNSAQGGLRVKNRNDFLENFTGIRLGHIREENVWGEEV